MQIGKLQEQIQRHMQAAGQWQVYAKSGRKFRSFHSCLYRICSKAVFQMAFIAEAYANLVKSTELMKAGAMGMNELICLVCSKIGLDIIPFIKEQSRGLVEPLCSMLHAFV